MAYQFFHIDAVSNEERELYIIKNKKKIIIGHISNKSILEEAGRLEGYISHIDNPLRPVVLYGDKEKGIEDVRKKIENWVEGTKDARGHKVRKDANSLLSGVVSWPPINDDEDEKEYDDRRKAFEKALLVWLKNVYRDDLVMVLRHDDEPFRGQNAGKIHYHWHFFCVKQPGEKFDLHPGFKARSKKDISRKDKKNMTPDEIKAALKEGREAYRKAMSDFQERFYQELGKDHGLGRYGPSRERRSRSEQLEFEAIRDKVIEDAKVKAEKNVDKINKQAEENKRKTEVARKQAEEAKKKAEEERQKAEEALKQAGKDAQKMKDDAWKVARDIENGANAIKDAAKIEANKILEESRGFVKMMLEKISKLPGGVSIVKWAWTFFKPIKNPKSKNNEPVRDNTHHNNQKNSR
jgi:hypothetical protein